MAETTTIEKEVKVIDADRNGSRALVPTDELAIAKLVTKKQLIEEERSLQKVETSVEGRYHGIRGYLRIFQVTRVIALLSLYLYLDQLDLHQKHDKKYARHRSNEACVSRGWRFTAKNFMRCGNGFSRAVCVSFGASF